jgi:hypothetical protein
MNAGVKDAFGNSWWIGTHLEDVTGEELAKRARLEEEKRKAEAETKK